MMHTIRTHKGGERGDGILPAGEMFGEGARENEGG